MFASKLLGDTGLIKMTRLNSFEILMTREKEELSGVWEEKDLEHMERSVNQRRCLEIVT